MTQLRFKIRGFLIRLRRAIYKNRTSYPYITGDSIAELVDYCPYGKNGERSPEINKIRSANSVFIPGHLFFEFVENYCEVFLGSVLVTGNSDQNFTSLPKLPGSVKFWLAQNLSIEISNDQLKVRTLPIGIENFSLGRAGRPKYFRGSKRKIDRVFVPPMAPSNPIRQLTLDKIETITDISIFDIYKEYLPERKYFKIANKFRFVLCLEGNGFENHRIWETLYSGSFPVLLNSNWSKTLMRMNLPILFVDDVTDLNTGLLNDFAESHANFNPSDTPSLWIPYWKRIIESHLTASNT